MALKPGNAHRAVAGIIENSMASNISREGISVLSEGPDKLIDVVLIHGLNGHPEKTWTYASNSFFWPRVLAQRLPTARVMLFGYDADISSSFASNHTRIKAIASDLLNELRNARQEADQVQRPLLLVGHSLGGLVVKHALIRASRFPGNDREHIYRATKSAIFFATPNAGSDADKKKRVQMLKNIGKVAFKRAPPKIESALQLHSDELIDLADEFRLIDICDAKSLQIYSFYELKDTKLLGDLVVDEFSARAYASNEELFSVNADHEGIVKFADESDKTFRTVQTIVKTLIRQTQNSQQNSLDSDFAVRVLRNGLPNVGTIAETIAATHKARRSQYYQIPRERKVKKFVGRRDVLANINTIFAPIHSDSQQYPTSLVLIGMGGIGKTQIVLEYCHKAHFVEKHFTSVFWVNAHSKDAVINSLARIADDLGIQASDVGNVDQKVNFVLETWTNWHSPYLVIYDNFDDPEFQDIQTFVPPSGPGALLFTSRLRGALDVVDHSIEISVMTEGEAVDLLISRSGQQRPASGSPEDIDGKEVARALECLPLALDQAGAYIRSSSGNVSFKVFLDHFDQRKRQILEHVPTFWQYRDYANEREQRRYLSVVTTWELSLKLLGTPGDDHENKVRFLTLAAFLGGHRVAKVLFKTYLQHSDISNTAEDATSILKGWSRIFRNDAGFDDNRFRRLVVDLNDLSLIRGFTETSCENLHFSMHSLVQDWAKLRLPSSNEQGSYSKEAINIMQSFFETFENQNARGLDIVRIVGLASTSEPETGSFETLCGEMMAEIAAHVQACIKQAALTGPELDGSTPIEPHFAAFIQRYDLSAAGIIWERMLHHSITWYGILDERTLEMMRSMSRKGAQLMFAEAFVVLDALKQTYGAEHPDYMLIVSQMITIFNSMPLKDGGELLLELVTELKGALDHVNLDHRTSSVEVALKVSLGLITLDQLDAAQLLFDRACVALPAEEEGVSISPAMQLCKLVRISLLQRSSKYEEFRKFAQQYIEEEERRQNEQDPKTILVLRILLANSYMSQQHWKDAATVLEVSLTYSNRKLGPLDMMTQVLGITAAEFRIRDNPDNFEASEEKIRNIIKLQREFQGKRCKKTVMVEMRAATAYNAVGKHRLSFELYKECYLTHRQWLRPDDSFRLSLEDEYAMSLTMVPDRSASEITDITDMFMDRISFFGGKYQQLQTELKLADFWYGVKYYEKVLELFGTAIKLKEHSNSMYDRANIPLRKQTLIASCYRSLGRWDEAMSWYCDIVKMQKICGGGTNEETAMNLVYYAHACKNARNWTKAEDVYQQILEFRINSFGQQHAKTITAMEWLAQNSKDAGLFAQAEVHFKQVLAAKQNLFGNNDKTLIPTLLHLVDTAVLQKTDAKLGEAESHLRRVVHLRTLHESANSKGVADVKKMLGDCLFQLKRYSEAIPPRRDVLNWYEMNHGHDAQSTIARLSDMANAQLFNFNSTEALDGFLRVLNWQRAAFGNDITKNLAVTQRVGYAYLGMGQLEAALPYLIEVADAYMALPSRSDETISALEQVVRFARILSHSSTVEKYRLCILKCMEDAGQPLPMLAILSQRYGVAVARLQQGRAAEAEADIAKALEVNQQDDPGSLNTALNCYWYAESQTLLQKHEIAADYYAIFVSYQREVPTGNEDSYVTWGRSWIALQEQAWKELELFNFKQS